MSLRRAAIWYPNIIPHGLVLNEDSFTGENPLSTGYQPLSWIHFGGRDGTAMPQVRGIQAKFTHYVLGLQVIYNEAHERRYSDILGPGGEIPLSGTSPPFPIDGADGERIDSVSVGIRRYTDTDIPSILRHGLLDYIEVSFSYASTKYLLILIFRLNRLLQIEIERCVLVNIPMIWKCDLLALLLERPLPDFMATM